MAAAETLRVSEARCRTIFENAHLSRWEEELTSSFR
jgi:hypothetical protein